MQTDINNYVAKDRISNASFRQKLDPIGKNIIRWKSAVELVVEDISAFDAENTIVGPLSKELDVRKKDIASELIKKAPRPPGVDDVLRKRLDKLKNRPKPKDDYNISPLASLPPHPRPSFSQRPLSGPPPPPPFVPSPSGSFLEPFQQLQPPPMPHNFIGIPPAPSVRPLSLNDYNRLGPSPNFTTSNSWYGSQTQTLTREREETKNSEQKELDDKIYELPIDFLRLELEVVLAYLLEPEAKDIFDEKRVNKKEIEDESVENIKEEYGFDEIKYAFNEAFVPHQLDFFCGGSNGNFFQACNFLLPNNDSREFIAFFISDTRQKIMTNNSLSIHIES